MFTAYRYIFSRVLRWRKDASVGPTGAVVFLSLLAVLNLWSVLLIVEATHGRQVAKDLDSYGVYGAMASYLFFSVVHHFWLVRHGRYKEIEAEFRADTARHLAACFYAYVCGSIVLFFLLMFFTTLHSQ